MKKTLSIILAILMIVASVPLALAIGDGTPLSIDVADSGWIRIGSGRGYYDEDGYILTGSSEDTGVDVYESCSLTFKDVKVNDLRFAYAPNDSVINITFDGTNEVVDFISLFKEHLVFEGDETATFKAPYFSTAGNSGTVTVNGGNLIVDRITDENTPTIDCKYFIINGGTVTASNNYSNVIDCSVELNGGTLHVISTAPEYEALDCEITMDKGALLIISSESGKIFYHYGTDILKADGLTETDSFFVRYDKTSDFAPVYNIKSALEGNNYAEVKIDTHEHEFTGKYCVCGCPCPHAEVEKHYCIACGKKVSSCEDANQNHECDICGEIVSTCTDRNRNHECDICGEKTSECADKNKNHKCDICDEILSECADEDKNHKCDLCNKTLSECTDEDNDYLCDYGCGTEFENPADTCGHLCHKTGIMSLFWKIINFFSKLFKINPVCECGTAHY